MRRYLVWLMLLGCAHSLAIAQETPAPPATTPSLEARPAVVPPDSKEKDKEAPKQPARPAPPNRPPTPATVKELVKDFQAAREAYMATQRDLRRQLREASDEKREAIREKLRENLEAWSEVQRARVEELREQIRETKKTVQGYDKVIDAAQEKGRRP